MIAGTNFVGLTKPRPHPADFAHDFGCLDYISNSLYGIRWGKPRKPKLALNSIFTTGILALARFSLAWWKWTGIGSGTSVIWTWLNRTESGTQYIPAVHYTVSPKKTKQICFCQNFVKFPQISIIFGSKMGNDPDMRGVLIFHLT